MDDIPSECRVVPFGNLRIKGYLHLPEAYRSLSRPSSPPRAKASAMRPCLLSFKRFILVLVLVVECFLLSILHTRTRTVWYILLALTKILLFVHHVKDRFSFQRWWRITDSNRWPSACKADALASWANPPRVIEHSNTVLATTIFVRSSPRQSWTADLYIISVAL